MSGKLSIIAEHLDKLAEELDQLGYDLNTSLLDRHVKEIYGVVEKLETIAEVIE